MVKDRTGGAGFSGEMDIDRHLTILRGFTLGGMLMDEVVIDIFERISVDFDFCFSLNLHILLTSLNICAGLLV